MDTFLSTVYVCVCVLYVALEDNKDNERMTMERSIFGAQDSLYMIGHAMIQGCPYMLQGRILGHHFVCIVSTYVNFPIACSQMLSERVFFFKQNRIAKK